ncbi:hypothetical protein [Halorussus pelagicus]|uniref:hypothetical protein n=1 Tax=Halorussus pelagicus TaxID=2505977 RepID=UPI000FFB5FA7|nr:hypothetical protein [Halorussus pelagicus]
MTVRVETTTDAEAWDSFVDQSPQTGLFHQYDALAVLADRFDATLLEATVADSRLTDEATGRAWQSEIPADRTAICESVRFGVERSKPGEQFRAIPDHEREELLGSLPDDWEEFDATQSVSPAVERQLETLGYR